MTASSVHAKVRYLNSEWKDRKEPARIGDRESRRANTTPIEVEIFDARPRHAEGALDLDASGFVLRELRSAVSDFRDENGVRAGYYPQIRSLIKDLTGAHHVFMLQHLVRTESTASFNNAYARFIHCDYSANDASNMARRTLERNGIDPRLAEAWQFAWFNAWQPFDREVQQNPLTLIDVTSLAGGDIVDYFYTGYGNDGRSSMPTFNPRHRFFYFPRMRTDEVMIFKQGDTRPGLAQMCPHTSFDDPTAPGDALGRRSIETRVMCAFES